MPRGVSDHSGLTFNLTICPRGMHLGCRIQPYWLTQIGLNDRIPEQMEIFLEAHGDRKMDGIFWGTFKAYLREALKSTISHIKRINRQEEEELVELCAQAEADIIKDPSNKKQIRWGGLMRQYKNQSIVNAKRKRFFLKQKHFEQGHQANKMPNFLIKQQSSSLAISKVRNKKGEVFSAIDDMLTTFHKYYVNMYTSMLICTVEERETYLEDLEFLKLTEEQKEMMENEIEEEEVREAILSLGKGKSPGPDSIQLEVYHRYVEIMVPVLTRMFREIFCGKSGLPLCMWQQCY